MTKQLTTTEALKRIWQDDNFEFWFCDFILEMRLNPPRLDLMKEIIKEMNRYNDGVLL